MALSNDPVKRAKQLANLREPIKKGETRNPNGRRAGSMRKIIDELKKNGYDIPSKEDIRDGILVCAFGNREQIASLINNDKTPMALRIIAREVLGDNGFNAVERILDRTIGKILDITTNDKPITQDKLIVEVIDKAEQVDKTEEEG